MTSEARKMLDQIDEFFSRNDSASAEVAAVLTALRSEDTADGTWQDVEKAKTFTTIPIRRAAFPQCATLYDNYRERVMVGWKSDRFMGMSLSGNKDGIVSLLHTHTSHARTHIRLAAEVLGLKIEGRTL